MDRTVEIAKWFCDSNDEFRNLKTDEAFYLLNGVMVMAKIFLYANGQGELMRDAVITAGRNGVRMTCLEECGAEIYTANFLTERRGHTPIRRSVDAEGIQRKILACMDNMAALDSLNEVIFADGGSTDGTPDIIGERYRVLRCGKGRERQMNAATNGTNGDMLWLPHCDDLLPKDGAEEINAAVTYRPRGSGNI